MRYYYFNPFNKKCYFPEGFQNYPLFSTFYKPYKLSAKLMWQIWRSSKSFRNLFTTNQPEKILPIVNIRKYVSGSSILAFNLGTLGIEQKITVIGIDTTSNATFFIKYATSELSRKNVTNEGFVLRQLLHLSFVPKLQLYVKESEFDLIKTSVLKGEKMKHPPMNEQLLTILFTLSSQSIKSYRKYDSYLLNCFAHGDFCPWNMLNDEGDIKLFDWEMAGQYPLGYDLFSYIFQFEFLVNEKMRFDQLLIENSEAIRLYFNYFEVNDWIPYLQEFSNLKYKQETKKSNLDLIEPYSQLKKYALKKIYSNPIIDKKRQSSFKFNLFKYNL